MHKLKIIFSGACLLVVCACSHGPHLDTSSHVRTADSSPHGGTSPRQAIHRESARSLRSDTSHKQAIVEVPSEVVEVLRGSNRYVLPEHRDQAASDVWARIRWQQYLPRHTSRQRVRQELAWFRNRPDYLARVSARAAPYIHYIVERIEARGMPAELALLPIVESAFRPTAYSRSHAVGLWQFIPSTGKRYGLLQQEYYDERRDILASTRAALDYLQFLHNMFSGDWYHALAAYNAGEHAVLRAINRRKKQGRSYDFWSLSSLPKETRRYVPKLLAVAEVVSWPDRYGQNLTRVANRAYFKPVSVKVPISLTELAALSEVPLQELQRLNPSFKSPYARSSGPRQFLLPVRIPENQMARINAYQGKDHAVAEGMTTHQHRIRKGETLGIIAARYGVSVASLKAANGLQGDRIYSGKTLFIPLSVTISTRRLPFLYVVQSGDTLWKIGRSYGVTVRELQKWNNIAKGAILRPGQKLAVRMIADA